MSEPRRALISVYDKTGIVDLARGLAECGWTLISSGGTAAAIAAAGIDVTDVADHTGSPPMLGHRVVTLHPRVHGGILADRDDPEHRADLDAHDIDPIDLVVVNLYPFATDPGIELIDVGGPTLVRAAAKNHAHVGVVVDPGSYDAVLAEIRDTGRLGDGTRQRLAREAFAHSAAYDAAIVAWFDGDAGPGDGSSGDDLPPSIHLALERAETLRYGENPHQRAARYRTIGAADGWWDRVRQHSGLPLSYLNLYDSDAAWQLVGVLGPDPAAVVVKHANPCGAAVADDLATAYGSAYACDPRSAFGGVVACNRPVDPETVAAMEEAAQADVILAPGFEDDAVDRLRTRRKNTRLLEVPGPPPESPYVIRTLADGYLVQDRPRLDVAATDWTVVTRRRPSDSEWADAEMAWKVCAHVRSNAIVLARDGVAWGIGAGQQNRVEAGQLAATKADGRARGGACASDAFYPFPDGIHAAADAGVAVVVQPGGSMGDDDVIAAADERGLAMLFTGERQFLH